MSDFVPDNLVGNNNADSGADTTVPVKPLVNNTRNTTQNNDNSWYCHSSSDASISNNVFCNKGTNTTDKSVVFESSGTNKVEDKMVDNSVGANGNNISQPSANQQTLQDQQVRNAINKTQNGFSVPLQPSDDVKLNINQQQIQFNIQY